MSHNKDGYLEKEAWDADDIVGAHNLAIPTSGVILH